MALERRTPLRRGTSQLKRSPIARKRATPRRVKKHCLDPDHPRCKRYPSAGLRCLTHAKQKADQLWGQLVRTDECAVARLAREYGLKSPACNGPIQACHGFSRGYMGTRYLLENGFSGCASHNLWAELKPLEWDEFLRAVWGAEYQRLRTIALDFGKDGANVDYEATIADFEARRDRKREGA
jgi:hypothetical protein